MSLGVDKRVQVDWPGTRHHGCLGVIVRDGGVAEHGPVKGAHFWWVQVDGVTIEGKPRPLIYQDEELRPVGRGDV